MSFEPLRNSLMLALKPLSAIARVIRWTAIRVVRLTHYGIYKTFIRNEPLSRRMLPPTLNEDDLKFLIFGGLLLMCILSMLYWIKVIGIHR